MHSRSLIRLFIGSNWIAKGVKLLHADNEDSGQTAHTYLSLCWAHISEGTFSHVSAQIMMEHIGITQLTVQHLCNLVQSVGGSASDCRSRDRRFESQLEHTTSLEIDHEIISTVIPSIPSAVSRRAVVSYW